MEKRIIVRAEDAKRTLYFLSTVLQNCDKSSLVSTLNAKQDYMGGKLDRCINMMSEEIVFDRIILPQVNCQDKVSAIRDYYVYNPEKAGIAPDVIGIKVGEKSIPFVKYSNEWQAVEGCPQIEVKTSKKNQKMISLLNQGYDDKYLVFAQMDLRMDYLIPFLAKSVFENSIHEQLLMDDQLFIVKNDNLISQPPKVDCDNDKIGTVELLIVTKTEDFLKKSTEVKEKVEIEYFKEVIEYAGTQTVRTSFGRLSKYVEEISDSIYEFNSKWYNYKKPSGTEKVRDKEKAKTITIHVSAPQDIEVKRINKGNIIIEAVSDCTFGSYNLKKGVVYDIKMDSLTRGKTTEHFLLKSSIPYLKDYEEEIVNLIQDIIDENN